MTCFRFYVITHTRVPVDQDKRTLQRKHRVVQAYVQCGGMAKRQLGAVVGTAGQPAKKRKARSQVTKLYILPNSVPHQRILDLPPRLPYHTKLGRDSHDMHVALLSK